MAIFFDDVAVSMINNDGSSADAFDVGGECFPTATVDDTINETYQPISY